MNNSHKHMIESNPRVLSLLSVIWKTENTVNDWVYASGAVSGAAVVSSDFELSSELFWLASVASERQNLRKTLEVSQ